MSTCCGTSVRYVTVGNQTVIVDAEPHPAGVYAVYAVRNAGSDRTRYFGYSIGRDQPPRSASHTRHRIHNHRQGD